MSGVKLQLVVRPPVTAAVAVEVAVVAAAAGGGRGRGRRSTCMSVAAPCGTGPVGVRSIQRAGADVLGARGGVSPEQKVRGPGRVRNEPDGQSEGGVRPERQSEWRTAVVGRTGR